MVKIKENTTAIKTCTCQSAYQDKKYGKNKRVHNSTSKVGFSYRCTVCKKER